MKNLLALALNKTLSLDPESFDRIKQLHNKTLCLTILPLDVKMCFNITSSGFESCETTLADITVSGKPSDFIKFSQDNNKNLYNSGIKIVGDMGLADEIKTILSQLDLDWEGFIANYTGDVPARLFSQGSKKTFNFVKQAKQNFKRDTIEYFQEEIQILPTRVEMENFNHAVAELRDATARLEAKINA
jgi:ubiquinone biosynthesis protein UbiJ